MIDIELRRRFFAEELEAVCRLRTPALVDAFARVARDAFLPPGPWTVLADGGASFMMGAGVRTLVTHPLDTWLDALAPGGRMMLPLTVAMPAMGSTLGKGLVVLVTKDEGGVFSARVVTVAAVYSALGIRDDEMNERIGKALTGGPAQWMAVKRLRRDSHEPDASCWLHGRSCCFCAM